jgi:hypothetical protein
VNSGALQAGKARCFRFVRRCFDPHSGQLDLVYAIDDAAEMVETLQLPLPARAMEPAGRPAFERALDVLHLVAGVSYYKAVLPPLIDTGSLQLDSGLAGFLQHLYTHGLAEFAHRNGLDLRGRVQFPVNAGAPPRPPALDLRPQALVAMGGGKDSLVSLELLRAAGLAVQPFAVGSSPLIAETVAVAGLPFMQVPRTLAPALAQMNEAGAWNGHVPVTAINSLVGVCLALLHGMRWVVFSNERSADEATLVDDSGHAVNHQYSKSLDFERRLRALLHEQVSAELEYFSLLRPLSEAEVARRFSKLSAYHPVFSSCNRNFHHQGSRISGRWCGDCPKCRFTSLALAPQLTPAQLQAIIGRNLLADPGQLEGFRALCALRSEKPWECVGEAAESRALLAALLDNPDWLDAYVVQALAADLNDHRGQLADWYQPGSQHCIPAEVLRRVDL